MTGRGEAELHGVGIRGAEFVPSEADANMCPYSI